MCKQAGFEAIEADVLELLTHMVNSYLNELAITTRLMTEHAGRCISTPTDTLIALVDLGSAVSDLPAFLKETTSKGSLVIAPPRVQQAPHTQSQPRPSHIPEWMPPFPDPHTYVRTDISGEPEPSYEKARESLASLHRNTIVSLKDFVVLTHPSISLFDAHKQRVLKRAADAAAERTRQRQAQMMASVEENDEKPTLTNGEAVSESKNDERLAPSSVESSTTEPEKSYFEDENATEISLLHTEAPTFSEIIEPEVIAQPYLDALLADLRSEASQPNSIKKQEQEETGQECNPFLRAPKMPSQVDDDEMMSSDV
ncbi:unnamed protein product [Gongylonema pulchrum]|uniref:Transcription initiation factor TFIID subunit 8 n=1 Tax=Gongylonema pulchrum TaxID=637853 RepID=A0A183DVX0_9BILA|nr:unnamed protein product [Gongylonema pulchrum]